MPLLSEMLEIITWEAVKQSWSCTIMLIDPCEVVTFQVNNMVIVLLVCLIILSKVEMDLHVNQ